MLEVSLDLLVVITLLLGSMTGDNWYDTFMLDPRFLSLGRARLGARTDKGGIGGGAAE